MERNKRVDINRAIHNQFILEGNTKLTGLLSPVMIITD